MISNTAKAVVAVLRDPGFNVLNAVAGEAADLNEDRGRVKPAFQVSWFAGVRMSKSGGLGSGMGGLRGSAAHGGHFWIIF